MEFDPERRELIEAVLEPLAHSQEARKRLELCVASAALIAAANDNDSIGATAERTKRSIGSFLRFRRVRPIAIALILLGVLWLALLSPGAREQLHRIRTAGVICRSMMAMDGNVPPSISAGSIETEAAESWEEAYRYQVARMHGEGSIMHPPFIYPSGDWSAASYFDGVKEAARLDPGDPAKVLRTIFLKFRSLNGSEEEEIEDLCQKFEKLDPDNGILHLWRASNAARESLADHPYEPITSADREKLNLAIQELETASSFPRWDDYSGILWERESADWPVARDFPEQVFAILTLLPTLQPSAWWRQEFPSLVLSPWIEIAAADSDPGALDGVAAHFDSLRYRWSGIATNYPERNFQAELVREGATSLSMAYAARGVSDQSARYDELAKSLDGLTDNGAAPDDFLRMGYLGSHILQFTMPVAGAGDEGIAAGRMAEYAMWERFTFHAIAVLLVIAGSVFLALSGWSGWKDSGLAARLAQVLTRRDRVMILLGSVGVPAGIYLVATRCLPVRDKTMLFPDFLVMLDQALMMSTAMLSGSMFMANRLLVRRGRVLGFRKGLRSLDGWIAIYCMAGIPLCDLLPDLVERGYSSTFCPPAVFPALLLAPCLWGLMRLYLAVSAAAEMRPLQAAQIRVCVPGICIAAILAVSATFVLHAWESRLVAKMTLGSVRDPQLGFVSPAQLARAEKIRQALAK